MTRPPTSRSRRARRASRCRCAAGCRPRRPSPPRPVEQPAGSGRASRTRSASVKATCAPGAASTPARTAAPLPRFSGWTHAPGRRPAAAAGSAVSSGDPSSTTTISSPPSAATRRARRATARPSRRCGPPRVGGDHDRQPHRTRRRGSSRDAAARCGSTANIARSGRARPDHERRGERDRPWPARAADRRARAAGEQREHGDVDDRAEHAVPR